MYETKIVPKLRGESEKTAPESEDQKDQRREDSFAVGKDFLSPARLPGESFDHYKERRKAISKGAKSFSRGRMIWDSKSSGTVLIREEAKKLERRNYD